jgi:predicted transcriptional regulator YheO
MLCINLAVDVSLLNNLHTIVPSQADESKVRICNKNLQEAYMHIPQN